MTPNQELNLQINVIEDTVIDMKKVVNELSNHIKRIEELFNNEPNTIENEKDNNFTWTDGDDIVPIM